jgi:hypothetical protein
MMPEKGISVRWFAISYSFHGVRKLVWSCRKVAGMTALAFWAQERMADRGSTLSSAAAPVALVER